MSLLDYLNEISYELTDTTRIDDMREYYNGHIIGLGANIMNGYSYEFLVGNLTYLCNCEEGNGLKSPIFRLIYIKDYKMPDYGFQENHVSSPERTICDFLMYPKELDADFWLWDAIEGYIEDDETPDDFSLVYEMMEVLGINKALFDEKLELFENMSHEH